MPDFAQFYFGVAAAENEVATNPDRFRETYFDRLNLPAQIASHERCLILGPKGAGKSAAAWYVALSWQKETGPETIFRNFVDFDVLNRTQSPLTSLDRRLVSGDLTAMTDAAWRLFLGVRLLESIINDPACSLGRDAHAVKLLRDLQAAGLASDDYPQVLRSIRERKGTIGIPKWINGGFASKETESLSPGQVGDAILKLVMAARTPNRHLLAIDGLDKAITRNEAYWQTIAALIRVVDDIRRVAVGSGASHIFVIVMCRSDVFRQAHFADAPKIAADAGVHLEWHAEAAEVRHVLLWEYLARKASISTDVLFRYLPTAVKVGNQGGVETLRYLLDFTRYTPRDLSLLFRQLQAALPPGAVALTAEQVRLAADRFASENLLSEIIAEAVGLLSPTVVDRLSGILSSLPKRIFSREHLERAIKDAGCAEETSSAELAEYLFLQGAIGNYKPDVGYYQFYHRRDAYKLQLRGPLALHTGLVYAMNVPWSGT